MSFSPIVGMPLSIDTKPLEFMPNPYFGGDPQEVFVIEGGESLLYQLCDKETGWLYALKVMKPSYRSEQCARVANTLVRYKDIPGFSLARRICLTRPRYANLIAAFPDLEYATLMPWLAGKSWAGLLLDRTVGAQYSRERAYRLATTTAHVSWQLEGHNLAHTDIAGSNILISQDFQHVELLDIEGLYIHGSPLPKWRSQGTPGYQHRRLDKRGQWRPEGDRFAGAMLLTEMLTWWHPVVRAHTPDDAETLFQPDELQTIGSPRWQAVRDTLWSMNPDLLLLFDQAWAAPDLADCPDLSSWAMCLISA